MLFRSSEGNILGDYGALVLDEAHNLERVAADCLGFALGRVQADSLLASARRMESELGRLTPGVEADRVRRTFAAFAADLGELRAGIGGLTLGLMLHRAGIPCRIYESTQELKAVGVGISVLPHASRELVGLGLEEALANVAVTTREFCFYNRYGQFIYREPAGRYAEIGRAHV